MKCKRDGKCLLTAVIVCYRSYELFTLSIQLSVSGVRKRDRKDSTMSAIAFQLQKKETQQMSIAEEKTVFVYLIARLTNLNVHRTC